MADSSGLTPQERHNIINDKLAEYKKKVKVFHMRWTPGDLLDGKVLKSTPAFWYMRFGWSRAEIEGLFYAARIYIDTVFESSLDAVFGTDGKGPRWLPPEMQEEKRGKWNRRQYYKTKPWWEIKELGNINGKQQPNKSYKDEPYAYDKEWRYKQKNYDENDGSYGSQGGKNGKGGKWSKSNQGDSMNRQGRRRSILNSKLTPNAEKIWQKASNYGGKNEKINYKQFKDGLNAHNIEIDEDTAKKLFNVYADKDGLMDYSQFLQLLKKLDDTEVKVGVDIGDISLKDLGNNFNTILLMKRVLLAAAMDVPFNVTDFLNGNISANIGNPGLLLGKLATRDADWNERLNIMENIANNLGTNPEYDEFLEPQHASDLLMGWTAQMLDTKQPVSQAAIDQLPTVFHEIADKSHPDVAMAHLDDVVDGLFNVLDNKKHEPNHEAAKKALKDIVDDVVHNQDAESVLYLAGLLGEKTDIENCTDPDAREAALDNIKRIMMGDNAEPMDPNKMPSKADDPNKEWLDTGVGKRDGPSEGLMDQGKDNPNNIKTYYPNGIDDKDLTDDYNNSQKGKKGAQLQKSGDAGADGKNPAWGGNKENYGSGPKGDRFGPNGADSPSDDPNGNNYNDTEDNPKYGGTDQVDSPLSEYGSEPDNPRAKKGKQNDVSLKFGKNNNNDPNDASNNDPNNGPESQPSSNFEPKYDVAQPTESEKGLDENYSDFDHIGFDGKANDGTKQVHGQKTNPIKPKRKKGKEKELALKFGRYGNRDPPMHSNENELYDTSDPRFGSQKPKNIIGNPNNNNNNNNTDDNKNNGPNQGVSGGDNGDGGDLDDSGNPNDPGNKGGKRGGTKRQGTNGKNDFDGKFGDDSKKQSPYGPGRTEASNDETKNIRGDYSQPRGNPNDGANSGDGKNPNGPNSGDDEKQGPLTSNEIGDEFRNVVSDAVSNALLDPNKKNKENGAKLADTLDQMAPANFPDTLDGDAKKKYLNWKRGPLKPYEKKLPPKNKPLPGLKAGTAKVHTISGNQSVTIKPPTMPDI